MKTPLNQPIAIEKFNPLECDFITLDKHYKDFESGIVQNIFLKFLSYLSNKGATPKGSIFIIDNIPYRIIPELGLRDDRRIIIAIAPYSAPTDYITKNNNKTIKIQSIGMINQVILSWPKSIKIPFTPIADEIENFIKYQYNTLEEAFTRSFHQIKSILLRNIDDLLNIEIRTASKDNLLSKPWFGITNIKNKKFNLGFSDLRLKTILESLKTNQDPQYSPFELLTCLLKEDATDTFFVNNYLSQDKFYSLQLEETACLLENNKLWIAEKLYLDGDHISVRELCNHNGYILELACDSKIEQDLDDILNNSTNNLSEQISKNFKENVCAYAAQNLAINSISDKTIKQSALKNVSDKCYVIFNTALSNFIKIIYDEQIEAQHKASSALKHKNKR